MPTFTEEIDNRFTYHPPTDNNVVVFPKIRDCARKFAHLIDDVVPDGREKALALTKLEEVVMWANAGVARAG